MRSRNIYNISVAAALFIGSFVSFSAHAATSTCVRTGVYLGTTDQDGFCYGRGICDNAANAVNVSFSLLASNSNVLVMSFSYSELQSKQPSQLSNFTDGGTYNFEAPFSLSDPMFDGLEIPEGSWILPTSSTTVSISGDVVTVYITFSSHS